ncbi:MAG: fatty acid desaturase [Bacteroidetes bacterium]|nr:fatty acid desaturase [Bacteroidota bacterium]
MKTGKELILATKPFAKEIRSESWKHTIVAFVLLLSFLFGTLLLPGFLPKLLCSIGAGLMVIRTFIIYHDYLHHSILNKSPLARVIFSIFGVYTLAPVSIWKRSHDYHHKHNSKLFSASIGSYPIATKKKFLSMTARERRAYLATRHPITMLFGYITMFVIGMCLNSFLSSPRKHWDSLLALLLHLTASVLLFYFGGWQAWFLTAFLPFFLAFSVGAYLFYAQHNFPGVTFSSNTEWTYESAALESSSFMVMGPVLNWITANIGYHHIHHINARIPFYRLPEVMAAIPELQQAKRTSLSPRDMKKCIKLKVWDPERNQLIPLTLVNR